MRSPKIRILAALAAGWLGAGLSTAALAFDGPSELSPGDPLLVWASSEGPLRGALLELRAPDGRLLARTDFFALPGAPALSPRPRTAAAVLGPTAPAERTAPALPSPTGLPAGAALPGKQARISGALLGLPMEIKEGDYELRISGTELGGPAFSHSLRFRIVARRFESEDIPLDAANSALRQEPDPRKTAEALRLQGIYARSDPSGVFIDGPFAMPGLREGPARRTAAFGDRRRYRYADGSSETSVHGGIDFAFPRGSAIAAPARGRVVFAEDRIVTGKTLVLEHLPGLYSVYLHLDALSAPLGTVVERGEILGRSGSTGLSTGPHLHWELRAGGLPVDPEFWTVPERP